MCRLSPVIFMTIIALFLASNANAQSLRYSFSAGSRESPQVNIYLSARYDHLLQISPPFRHHRMWKECHPIYRFSLYGDCLASFDLYEPVLPEYYRYH
jgi:hypothetical protein